MCVGAFLRQKTAVFVALVFAVFFVVPAAQSFGTEVLTHSIIPAFQEDENRVGQAKIQADIAEPPLSFIANAGQVDANVRFMVKASKQTIFFTRHEVVFAASDKTEDGAASSSVVRLRFAGANTEAKVEGEKPLPGVANFFLGDDPENWRTNVPSYAAITYHNLYPGIDLIYSGKQGRLKSDFVVAPGADPTAITMKYSGSFGMYLGEDGALVLETPIGELVEAPPLIYQMIDEERVTVEGGYRLLGNGEVAFTSGDYVLTEPLIIDPTLVYSTYLGGSGNDSGYGIAVDDAGNAYVTGETCSDDFPTQAPLQLAFGGGWDAFVTKIDPSGSIHVYSTYLGGSGNDSGYGIAVDSAGNAYVTGETKSDDFPTQAPLQPAFGGYQDVFVTKIDASGALAYSTYLGGSSYDGGYGIAVDSVGNAYVTGIAGSGNFPTQAPLQPVFGGQFDVFVTKIDSSGALAYSTYLGGRGFESGWGIAVDSAGSAYVTGDTGYLDDDFPLQAPLQPAFGGYYDAFVTKINASGSALVYSTYLGGSGEDWGYGIAVDSVGNAYVTGETCSDDFPTQVPLQPASSGSGIFVTKINASGSALVYSTYLGGSSSDGGCGIAVDDAGNAYVTGETWSDDFPTQAPIQPAFGGGDYDSFVAKIDASGSALVYSTYLGGSGRDQGRGIAVDDAGNAYVTGDTFSADNFPTQAPIQPVFGGWSYDAFVAKIGTAQQVTIDGAVNHQIIDGFGGSVAFYESWLPSMTEPARTDVVNLLFRDLGGGILRLRTWTGIEPENDDGNPDHFNWDAFDFSSDPNQTWIATAAEKRGVSKIISSVWSPPGWMKDTGSEEGGGSLLPSMYQEFAEWLAAYIKGYLAYHKIDIGWVSLQNEPDFSSSWPTCTYTTEQLRDLTKVVGAKFAAEGINTNIVIPETSGVTNASDYINATMSDPVAAGYVDILAHHLYDVPFYSPDSRISDMDNLGALASSYGRPLWQTEYSDTGSSYAGTFDEALRTATHIHNTLVHENATAYLVWGLFWDDSSPGEGLILIPDQGASTYTITPKYYACKQFFKYIPIGAVRKEVTSSDGDILVSAYQSADTLVIEVHILRM